MPPHLFIHTVTPFFVYRHRIRQVKVEEVKLVTTKLGGQLEPFADVSKGYRLAKPLGWNRYDGTSGEYTVKMVDLVDPTTLVLLTNSPVKSDTEVRFGGRPGFFLHVRQRGWLAGWLAGREFLRVC